MYQNIFYRYTQYTPDWYIRKLADKIFQVVIELPIKCPIRYRIEGPEMGTKRSAKRAAALMACIELHKIGELDDNLKPKARDLEKADTSYLFQEWPEVKEPRAGSKNFTRIHPEKVCFAWVLDVDLLYIIIIITIMRYSNY